ncbi:MAG: hypothetical protein ACK40G_10690 [Cytophagaceae bacterium]
MKTINYLTFFVVLFLTTTVACKKDKGDVKPQENKTQLISRTWILTGASGPFGDAYSFVPACQRDNEYEVRTDNTFTLHYKEQKCASDPAEDSSNGNWRFIDNESKLVLDFLTLPNDTFEIVELSQTQLRVKKRINGMDGIGTFTPKN